MDSQESHLQPKPILCILELLDQRDHLQSILYGKVRVLSALASP